MNDASITFLKRLWKKFFELCISNLIRLSTILHSNICLTIFDPKYHDESKSELKYELSFFNSFVKVNGKKEADKNSPNQKKNKQNI